MPAPTLSSIDELAASSSLRRVPILRDLLLYLWQHRDSPVSEYDLGTQVLGRGASFDPKTDSVVWVHISRLRGKFKEHYDAHPDASRLTIPSEEYRLEFQAAQAPFRLRLAGASCGFAAALGLGIDNLRLRSQAKPRRRLTLSGNFW
jgi:hypothetical protein